MSGKMFSRKDFLKGAFCLAALPAAECTRDFAPSAPLRRSEERQSELVAKWDEATKAVAPEDYFAYFRDGDTRGFKALKALDYAFDRVLREIKETVVEGDAPAVWSVYNMGYIVKTRESLFSIDLKHRRAHSLVPLLDFALVTHKHGDHYDGNFCKAMDKAGKPVVSSFLKNTAFAEIKAKAETEGHADAFEIRDVAIRTFRVDHAKAEWGIDFTTAFEMSIGGFRLLHTGDCGVANDKLCVKRGRPDLWLLFPMTSLDVADAVRRIGPKRVAFGHLWELGHAVGKGRAHKWHIDRALPMAKSQCNDVSVAFWGDRIV
jgi:L-ascorbate metabolism protein UlaG (beta-lactamase superfamily)